MAERRVLVVEHQESCPPGHVGDWLTDAAVRLDVMRPYLGDEIPDSLDADGLLVMGGSMGATEDERAPWLPETRRLIRSVAEQGRPVLGVCLGHQLAAVALGGRVGRNPSGQTVGAREVTRDGDVTGDPVGSALVPTSVVPQWNDDAVLELPPGAVPVAHNDRGDLLMARLAPSVWGIQGHPEASADIVSGWATKDMAEGGLTGCSPDEVPAVVAEVDRRTPEVRSAWQPVVAAWAGLL